MIKLLYDAPADRAAYLLTGLNVVQAAVTVFAARADETTAQRQQPTVASAGPGMDSVQNGMNDVQQAAQRVTDASQPAASGTDFISGGPGYVLKHLCKMLSSGCVHGRSQTGT